MFTVNDSITEPWCGLNARSAKQHWGSRMTTKNWGGLGVLMTFTSASECKINCAMPLWWLLHIPSRECLLPDPVFPLLTTGIACVLQHSQLCEDTKETPLLRTPSDVEKLCDKFKGSQNASFHLLLINEHDQGTLVSKLRYPPIEYQSIIL